LIVLARWSVSDGGEYVVDDGRRVLVGECPVGDEAPVEGGAGEQVDGQFEVGCGGDLPALAGPGKDVSERFPTAFGELDMQVG